MAQIPKVTNIKKHDRINQIKQILVQYKDSPKVLSPTVLERLKREKKNLEEEVKND